ncbi:MAG: hypothetical protein HQ581_02485 [Planctomycetes bacterium]|nr:hypothetical protein [Planctomycetota bacterium]
MPELIFYHQVRVDGGERTGASIDGTTVLEFFKPESGEADPALLWYVDVCCEGDNVPNDAKSARRFFSENSDYFTAWLGEIATGELDIGFDAESRPFQREAPDGLPGVRAQIVISAVRRLLARDIADRIRGVAAHWKELLDRLAPLSVV